MQPTITLNMQGMPQNPPGKVLSHHYFPPGPVGTPSHGQLPQSHEMFGQIQPGQQGKPPSKNAKLIGSYVIDMNTNVGHGNFSNVYVAVDQRQHGLKVAVKVINFQQLKQQKLQHLIKNEVEVLRLLRHENVLQCRDVFWDQTYCYIFTEVCEGGSLERKIKASIPKPTENLQVLKKSQNNQQLTSTLANLAKPQVKRNPQPLPTLSEKQMLPQIRDIFMGLLYLQSQNIIHRDIKAANVFIKNNRAIVADFGFAKQARQPFKDELNIGSLPFMPPQAIAKNIYSSKTDVWAFGVLLYEIFHGDSPYANALNIPDLLQKTSTPLSVSVIRADLSTEMKELMLSCLQPNANKRKKFSELNKTWFFRKLFEPITLASQNSRINYTLERGKNQTTSIHKKQQSQLRNQRQIQFSINNESAMRSSSPKLVKDCTSTTNHTSHASQLSYASTSSNDHSRFIQMQPQPRPSLPPSTQLHSGHFQITFTSNPQVVHSQHHLPMQNNQIAQQPTQLGQPATQIPGQPSQLTTQSVQNLAQPMQVTAQTGQTGKVSIPVNKIQQSVVPNESPQQVKCLKQGVKAKVQAEVKVVKNEGQKEASNMQSSSKGKTIVFKEILLKIQGLRNMYKLAVLVKDRSQPISDIRNRLFLKSALEMSKIDKLIKADRVDFSSFQKTNSKSTSKEMSNSKTLENLNDRKNKLSSIIADYLMEFENQLKRRNLSLEKDLRLLPLSYTAQGESSNHLEINPHFKTRQPSLQEDLLTILALQKPAVEAQKSQDSSSYKKIKGLVEEIMATLGKDARNPAQQNQPQTKVRSITPIKNGSSSQMSPSKRKDAHMETRAIFHSPPTQQKN